MRITLINPRLKTWSPNIYPPLGLCYIAGALEQDRHEVDIMDMNSGRVSDKALVKHIEQSPIVGIGGLITEYDEVVRLVKVIKQANENRIVVLGGPLATTHSEELLVASGADVAVIGEGEQTIRELVGAIEHEPVSRNIIKGIVYRDVDRVVAHPPREPEMNLDNIPHPARHLLDMRKYSTHHFKTFGIKVPKMKSTTLTSSRGCVYKCSYCDRQACGTRWYARSPQDIISEMQDLKDDYGIRGFVFNDDTFVINRKRVLDFCSLLVKELPDAVWYCNGRVNLMDEEMIQAMAKSGCAGIAYGIESGNQAILDSVHKQITLEQVERITALTKKYGIHVTGYFMLGILGDTRQTIQETLDFAEKLDLDFYGFGITSPIPGTEMYSKAVEMGLVDPDKRLEDWSFHAQMNLTVDCSYEELEQWNEYAFKHFTIEKRWGKHYLLNLRLWWEGLRTLVFLARKRNVSELVKKVWVLLRH
jgi:radical SAM superfamily enzyme YgiQ (UPF0313 family)